MGKFFTRSLPEQPFVSLVVNLSSWIHIGKSTRNTVRLDTDGAVKRHPVRQTFERTAESRVMDSRKTGDTKQSYSKSRHTRDADRGKSHRGREGGSEAKKLKDLSASLKHVDTFYNYAPPGMIKEEKEKPQDSIPDRPENHAAREFLASAPNKGLWMPLGKEVKVMQCWRCKTYGHRTGDRECPMLLSGNMSSETFRYMHEDPMHDYIVESERRKKEGRIRQLKALLDSSSSSDDSSDSDDWSTEETSHKHRKRKRHKHKQKKHKKEHKKQKIEKDHKEQKLKKDEHKKKRRKEKKDKKDQK